HVAPALPGFTNVCVPWLVFSHERGGPCVAKVEVCVCGVFFFIFSALTEVYNLCVRIIFLLLGSGGLCFAKVYVRDGFLSCPCPGNVLQSLGWGRVCAIASAFFYK
ncbi:unnamed protein product, partial [Pylaiella littoralis]